MATDNKDPRPKAVLVGVQLAGVSHPEHEASLAELGRLVHTLGFDVVATVSQSRHSLASGAVLGEGKLRELAQITGGTGVVPSSAPERKTKVLTKRAEAAEEAEASDDFEAEPSDDAGAEDEDVAGDDAGGDAAQDADAATRMQAVPQATIVVVDHEISPSQARNLEKATGAEVLDRTGVIVEIFHRHAQSREAKLQVEIARLLYVVPRLRAGAGGGDRQRGGIGGKGAGESALELDRRKVRDRIAELRAELETVQHEQGTRRARRRDARRVVLVGYTNAGKSSMMRALTGSDVFVADRLFATLDTTVRALQPETRPRILVSDTVGFIKKLPHDLVASFRSTLDEALEAGLLLYLVDAADPTFRSQLEVTRTVLADIGADEVESRLILNKADRLDASQRAELQSEFPEAMIVSAHDPQDVVRVREAITTFFERESIEAEIVVRYGLQGVIGEIHENARVLSETYDEAGARFLVRAHPDTVARLRSLAER